MLTETIRNAAAEDVHDALFYIYGPSRIHELSRSGDLASYVVHTHHNHCITCRVHPRKGGVSIAISPSFNRASAFIILAGLVFFILPGLVAGLWVGVHYFRTRKRLDRYMEDITRVVEYQARQRSSKDRGGAPAELV
jgi:hypothetical protein